MERNLFKLSLLLIWIIFLGVFVIVLPTVGSVFLIATLSFLLVEFALIISRFLHTGRLVPWHSIFKLFQYDELLGYNLNPGFSTSELWRGTKWMRNNLNHYDKGARFQIKINRAAYRGQLRSHHCSENVFRILVIGESTTFGVFNDDGYTWPNLLEKELSKSKKTHFEIEVINLGVPSISFSSAVDRYLRDYITYDVDLLLIDNFFNAFFIYNFHPACRDAKCNISIFIR